jgi:hypothetical protein
MAMNRLSALEKLYLPEKFRLALKIKCSTPYGIKKTKKNIDNSRTSGYYSAMLIFKAR